MLREVIPSILSYMMILHKPSRRIAVLVQLSVLIAPVHLWQCVIAHRQLQLKVQTSETRAHTRKS